MWNSSTRREDCAETHPYVGNVTHTELLTDKRESTSTTNPLPFGAKHLTLVCCGVLQGAALI